MRSFAALPALLLAACSTLSNPPAAPAQAVLLGEQHDAPEHRQLQREWLEQLIQQHRLAAVAMEMAEQGTSTAGLSPASDEQAVRQALHWDPQAWPWENYREPIMTAVRAGVPVVGANLPRAQLHAAMADTALDQLLRPAALKAQQEAIRVGHCGTLPEQQIAPMTRVQIARDRAMARTLMSDAVPGKTVVLIAGAGHVNPKVGVPQYLPAGFSVQPLVLPPKPAARDYCAELRQRR